MKYRELREGIFELIPINNKGEYANINTNTGLILYCKRHGNILPSLSQINVLEFGKILSRDKNIWCGKQYIEWRSQYPEVYNSMIDRINNLEIMFI